MIRLTLLGGLDIVGPDNQSVQLVLQQPKRLALLMYLALGKRGTFRNRNAALALLWPELDRERGRLAPNQTTHFLRRSLDPRVVITREGELGAPADVLWCDAVAFQQAFERGDMAEALRLYSGDLLPGFSINAGPEFDQWLDGWRSRLQRSAAAGAWQLAESTEQSQQYDTAAKWARRAVDLSLNDEIAVQRLLKLLGRVGDGAGALEAYDRFATRLAQEYRQAKPSTETKEIVARIRAEAGPLSRVTPPELAPPPQPPPTTQIRLENGARPGLEPSASDVPGLSVKRNNEAHPWLLHETDDLFGRRLERRYLWVLSAALCALSIWALHGGLPRAQSTRSDGTTHLTVKKLANVGNATGLGDLGTALTSAIVDQLARVRSFDVVSETQQEPGHTIPSTGPTGPRLLLTGGVLQSGEHVRVDIAVTDAVSGTVVKTAVFEHPAGAPLSLIDTLSRQIASLVRTAAGREVQTHAWKDQVSSDRTYDLMQEARDDRDRAAELERSGEISTAARALESADSILTYVERIAPGWGEPSVERAELSKWLGALYLLPPLHNATRAETLLRKGIQGATRVVSLHSHDASALDALGSLYYWYWLVVPLPADSASRVLVRAERSLRGAVSADPNRASSWSLLSASLYARADYEGAYLAASHAYAADAYLQDSQEILNRLFITSYEIHQDSVSASLCNEIKRRFVGSWTSAYCQLGLLAWNYAEHPGSAAQAWRIAAGPAHSAQLPQARARLDMLVATVLARNGLRDSAEAVVRRAHESGAGDAELLPLEADVRIALRERRTAAALLAQYIQGRPVHRIGIALSRRFITLRNLPADAKRPPPVQREYQAAK